MGVEFDYKSKGGAVGHDGFSIPLEGGEPVDRTDVNESEQTGESDADVEVEPDEVGGNSDAAALYLQDMASVPLINAAREVELAKQIEEGKAQVADAALSSRVAWSHVFELRDKVESGETSLQSILSDMAESDEAVEAGAYRRKFLRKVARLARLVTASERTRRKLGRKVLGDGAKRLLGKELVKIHQKVTQSLKDLRLSEHQIQEIIEQVKKLHTRLILFEQIARSTKKRTDYRKSLTEVREIEKTLDLPAADIKRLVASILEGETKASLAKREFVEANLRLVVSIAKKYGNRGLQFLDLVQEGNLGLMRAVEKFDYRLGYRFSTYASWWIRQSITRALVDTGHTIRVPVHRVETRTKVIRTAQYLSQKLGRYPLPAELAEEAGLSMEEVLEAGRIGGEPISLDTPVGDEEESKIADFVADRNAPRPVDEAIEADIRLGIRKILASLSPREETILLHRFGIDGLRDYTLEELGERFSITRERIRQIEQKAIRRLRFQARRRKTGNESRPEG